jgi:two-component system cell cycle sensor histidine kinase/response regulator CckA
LIGEDVELVTFLASQPARVRADPGQVEQIVMNLAVNARDAMPQGGRLTIETRSVDLDAEYAEHHIAVVPGAYVLLAVSDTGQGMDAETQAQIFEPFFTTKEPSQGTGLGLSTVYGIVKQSGGNIWVYSEPGRGTTFKIYLPRIEEGAAEVKRAEAAIQSLRGSETILLVEDDKSVRDVVQRMLAPHGYRVLKAGNAAQAFRISDRHKGPIHLLLTDVVLPQMSGRELAEELARRRPEMVVLYVSGYADNAIVHHGVLDPGTAFLQKPLSQGALLRKVRQLLGPGDREDQ